ncbi:hypothetical protein MP638_000650 [Amoeboaphelidium occidentale]|nr:hypothetical protein MP638_000650 [Amoeboaphelidium occidentale]
MPFTEASIARAALPIAGSLIEQRRESWDLSDGDAVSAIARMKADGLTVEEMKEELRVFLYAKGILRDEETEIRKRRFDNLLYPDKARVSVDARLKLGAARQPHAYAERVQLSGLCYMHAPVILQHYLVAMHSEKQVPMLDMAVYLKKYMPAESLEDRIWKNQGGDSEAFLRQILLKQPAPKLLPRSGSQEMESYLKSFGPALISRFSVEEAFDSEEWQHLGPSTEATMGKHAMVLVGIRQEGGSTRYLVQNWWEKKAFVETDGAYLAAREALINFVQTPQTAMGSYPTNAHNHVECEMLDAQETFNSEGSF